MVIRTAVNRQRSDKRGPRVGHGWEDTGKKLPNKEEYILIGQRLGVPAEVSAAEYDKWEANRGRDSGRSSEGGR